MSPEFFRTHSLLVNVFVYQVSFSALFRATVFLYSPGEVSYISRKEREKCENEVNPQSKQISVTESEEERSSFAA